MTTPQDDPAEQLLDFLVYAPLGLLLEARDLVPRLAEKGRRRMGGQVTVARMVGELAVRQGQRQAERVLERLRQQNGAGAGSRPAGGRPAGSAGSRRSGPPGAQVRVVPDAPAPGAAAPAGPAGPATAGGSSDLAIPGYDTLSASQVVPRLEGLSAAELEAVRVYEQSTRARKTILTRIDQLRGRA